MHVMLSRVQDIQLAASVTYLARCDWGAILRQELHEGSRGVSLCGQAQVMLLLSCQPTSNLWQRPCPIHETKCSDVAWRQTLTSGLHKRRPEDKFRTSISFMSFMASMMQMVWPLVTLSPSFTKCGSPGAGARYRVPAIGDATCRAQDTHHHAS